MKPKPTIWKWQNGTVKPLRPIGRPGSLLNRVFLPVQTWWWQRRYGIGISRYGSAQIENGYFEEKRARELAELMSQLEQLGFYKYTEPQYSEEAKAKGSGFYGYYRDFSEEAGKPYHIREVTKRGYFADGENLAEGGVLRLLDNMKPFLELQGVHIASESDDFDENFSTAGGYSVTINGFNYPMYTAQELADDEAKRLKVPGGVWYYATVRCFAMINKLLEQAGSEERVYGVSGGNEGFAVFLTPEMYMVVKQSKAIDDSDKPWSIEELIKENETASS